MSDTSTNQISAKWVVIVPLHTLCGSGCFRLVLIYCWKLGSANCHNMLKTLKSFRLQASQEGKPEIVYKKAA
jgi:hypothetical protein